MKNERIPIEIRNQIERYESESRDGSALVAMLFSGAVGFITGIGFVCLLNYFTGNQ